MSTWITSPLTLSNNEIMLRTKAYNDKFFIFRNDKDVRKLLDQKNFTLEKFVCEKPYDNEFKFDCYLDTKHIMKENQYKLDQITGDFKKTVKRNEVKDS